MKKHSFALLSMAVISALMVFSPVTRADQEQELNRREQELNQREQALSQHEQRLGIRQKTYAEKVGAKALSGFTNINTAPLEIPKNIINTINEPDSNIAFGFIGGTVKGILNTVGRIMVGATDLITAPLPTLKIAQPDPIWQDFDVDTTYGQVFRLDNEPEFVKVAPVVETTKSVNCPAAIERSANCADANREINARFNRMFKKEVMK